MNEFQNLQLKVNRYHEALQNTTAYREIWHTSLKSELIDQLSKAAEAVGLKVRVEVRSEMRNLEAVVLTLGAAPSGLGEPVGDGLQRDLIKHNGALVYQQLFNGKILVVINFPHIEKYGQPQPPKSIAIYRPEELKQPFVLRHVETFISEITNWEDYDDEAPEPNQTIGFKFNFEQGKT